MTLAGFGPHTRQIGLFTEENDNFYCQYLCLTRPALDARALEKVIIVIILASSSPPIIIGIIIVMAISVAIIIFIMRLVIMNCIIKIIIYY